MTLVLANGCFDLLHITHLRYLQEARAAGDYLVVAVTMDKFVGKGPGRPVIPQEERMEMVKALRCVSAASLCRDSLEALADWKPDVFFKGGDRKKIGLLPAEISYCKAHGITIAFSKLYPLHTTSIIERIKCASA